MDKQGVSVIICCYNSAKKLQETVGHLANQKCTISWEIIVVDNASTDGTRNVATIEWAKYNLQNTSFRVITEIKPGLSFAREAGVNAAKNEYLIFCDDDNWLDENYIQNVFNLFESRAEIAIIGGIGSAEFETTSSKPIWFDKLYHGYAVGQQGNEESEVNTVYGAGMAIQKSTYLQAIDSFPMLLSGRKGNKLSAGDDAEICFRVRLAGYKVLYTPQLTFKHFLPGNRLTWLYLKNLHSGFAETFVVLDIYEKALNGHNSKLPLFYWLKKASYYVGIYIKYWPKQYLLYKHGDGTIEELHHIVWKIIAFSYLSYNFQTVAFYKNMVALKPNKLF